MYAGARVLSRRIISPVEEWPYQRPNGIANKFTTASMLNEMQWLIEPPAYSADLFVEGIGGWYDLQLSYSSKPVSFERAAERRRYMTEEYFSRIRSADVLVMTLGLIETWYDEVAAVYLNAPPERHMVRQNTSRYSLEVTSAADNLSRLVKIRELLKVVAPQARIIVTVSPVPLNLTFSGLHPMIANTLSKSTLRVAAGEFAALFDDVDYFPSYEMISLAPRAMAFSSDCLHVDDAAVHDVVTAFMRDFLKVEVAPPVGYVEKDYLDANPDVLAMVRAGQFETGYEHWLRKGRDDGQP